MSEIFITERLRPLLIKARQFIDEELIPLEEGFFALPESEQKARLNTAQEKARAIRLFTPHMPEADGGLGLTLTEFGVLASVLGRSPFGHYATNCQAPDAGNMELLHLSGSAAQKETFLRPLVAGSIRSCFSMTEPMHAGSNPVIMSTTAVKKHGKYVINGRKWFTTAADGASFAIVMAVTDADAPVHQRASMILVPTDHPGFRIVRNISIMGETGWGPFSHAEVEYTDCDVPEDHLIGREGEGFRLAQKRLGPGRIHHCMRWIGICDRAFDMLCRRAATRQLTADRKLADQQIVHAWIAECRAEIEASRLLVLHTARRIDEEGAKAASLDISVIKFYVARVLRKVLNYAIQVHGALGITDDLVLSFWYRHERGANIYDGPDEVHQSSVARKILRKYGHFVQNQ